MAEKSAPRHHTFDYVELAAPDVAAAKAFYAAAFGWEFNDYGPEYAGIRTADGTGEAGGLTAAAQPSAEGILVLLWSDDLDATVRSVQDAGGTVTNGPYEFPGGRRFHFQDPAGNELAVWSET